MNVPTHCRKRTQRELIVDLFEVAVAVAVDRAWRTRQRAAARTESPFVPPPRVVAELERAA